MSPGLPERLPELRESPATHPSIRTPAYGDAVRQVLSSFSHRCRNSLNGIKLSLYLVRRDPSGPVPSCWNELELTYQEIERLFNYLQTIYRPSAATMVRSPLGRLVADLGPKWRTWFRAKNRILEIDAPAHDSAGDFDPMQLGMGLDALVGWRAEMGDARCHHRLSWNTRNDSFEVRWDELAGSEVQPVDARQTQPFSEPQRASGLVLLLLARIAAAHSGELDTNRESALSLRLRWPQFSTHCS
jgi:hypothetical protein